MSDSERIERLERRCRWQGRVLGGMLLMLAVGGIGLGAQKPTTRFDKLDVGSLTARSISIRDANGKTRVYVFGERQGGFTVSDETGTPRISLTTEGETASMTIEDPERSPNFRLSQDGTGATSMNLMDRKGRIAYMLNSQGLPYCKECPPS